MKNVEKLKPMSRLKFQILYSNCAQAGWVDGEFSESLYQKYLLRYAYFLDYLQKLKSVLGNKKVENDLGFFVEVVNSDIVYLIDDSGLIHPVYLTNRIKIKSNYKQVVTIDKSNKRDLLIKFCQNSGLLVDLFPFPIKRDTKMRKSIVSEGYTFREHLIKYFEPFLEGVRVYLGKKSKGVIYFLAESPNEDNESTYVYNPNGEKSSYLTFPVEKVFVQAKSGPKKDRLTYIICPTYVGLHAYLEFKCGLKKLQDVFNFQTGSTYEFKSPKEAGKFIEDFFNRNNEELKKMKESNGYKEILDKIQTEIIKMTLDVNVINKIKEITNSYSDYTSQSVIKNEEIAKYLWLNGSNNPGQKTS